jgi:hypothetical protein
MKFVADVMLPDDAVGAIELQQQLGKVLDTLTPNEKLVIQMRFGLTMPDAHTLKDVGRCLGVSRERIRQIEAKALRKMRHPRQSDNLLIFVNEDKWYLHNQQREAGLVQQENSRRATLIAVGHMAQQATQQVALDAQQAERRRIERLRPLVFIPPPRPAIHWCFTVHGWRSGNGSNCCEVSHG